MKKLFLILIIVLSFLFVPNFQTQSFADSKFSTSLKGTYTVQPTGNTHGTFTVTLKNLTDKFYASSYTIALGFPDITNIKASDSDGIIVPVIKKTPDGQEIAFTFNHKAIGLGSSVTLNFSFDTSDVAAKNGSIWEVNIPGVQHDSDFSNFSVSVVVPPLFGSPIYTKPNVGSALTFTKDQLGTSGISLAFGHRQVYDFSLTYHLKNTQVFPVRTEIALPPNTTYQSISIDSIEPKPLTVTKDQDGNWMAAYSLLPSQVETIHVKSRAFVSLTPSTQILSETDKAMYLAPTNYWESNNEKIQKLANELHTPYAIYEYVVKSLTYDYGRVNDSQERLGALAVLEKPSSAVCLEFTDLFIALARAAGIPAREIDGYAYTQNSRERPLSLQKDILHAWPEYYDQSTKTWIMVDPTWENTTGGVDYFHTFDFDHIAFVIKGKDPNYPVPAGGYKLPNETQQDVVATFADNTTEPSPVGSFTSVLPPTSLAGFPISGTVTIENTGTTLLPSQAISIIPDLPFLQRKNVLSPDIPPFGSAAIPFTLGKAVFLTNYTGEVTMSLAGQKKKYPLSIVAFSLPVLIVGGIILVSICIIIFIFTRRPRRVSIF